MKAEPNDPSAGNFSFEQVLGVRFFSGSPADAVDEFLRTGGYVVIPASAALIKLRHDEDYRRALQNADLALADSDLLVLLWRLMGGGGLRKVSGIAYLKSLLGRKEVWNAESSFWIVPSEKAREKAMEWLREGSFQVESENFYVASSEEDSALAYAVLAETEKQRPRHIIIALSAGRQEKLGLYLREYLLYRPRIHCIGAALGFLTGYDHPIPEWAERFHLGWLLRLVAQPGMFLPRLGIAFLNAAMVFKYRSQLPPLKARWSEL